MKQNRRYFTDEDIVIYAAGTKASLHVAALHVYEAAKAAVARLGATKTDPDTGEVIERRFRFVFGEDQEDIAVKQRGFLHAAVFPQIAEQVTLADGRRFAAAVWKEFFRDRFLGCRWVMKAVPRWDAERRTLVVPKRRTPHRERVSTEGLSKRDYSDYIDRVIDTAITEFGVVFVFDQAEREAVRYRAPARKRREEAVAA